MAEDKLRKIVDLDLLIHTPARLAILIFLLPRGSATFPEVTEALDLTSGNLSSHVKKLGGADMIEVEKLFVGDKPTTVLHLTHKGKQSVTAYADVLRGALDQVE